MSVHTANKGVSIDYTIHAKQQPAPLVGDEHFPDGSVSLTLPPGPFTYSQVHGLIDELNQIAREMQPGRGRR